MKYRWDIKYLYWGITAFIVLALAILFANSLNRIGYILDIIGSFFNILMPVIYGVVIAYLLTPIVNFQEKKVFFKLYNKAGVELTDKLKKITRGISVFIALALMILMIYGLLYMLIPQLIDSITTFVISAPVYLDNFQAWALELMKNNPTLEQYFMTASEYFVGFLNDLLPQMKVFLSQLSSGIFDFFIVIKNVVIGFIISIYLLNSKEVFTGQSKKIMYAIFKPKRATKYLHSARFVHQKFSGFILGKIIDSIIIGIICYVVTSFMHTPYNVLVSVVIGVTNVIPFFGPYIGAIPTTLLILLVNPLQAVYFVIFIIILQTFDGNILGPRILSESTDLSSFWIIFAILLMGGLFGIVGMFVGVPIFAVIYAAIAGYINDRLKARHMSTDYEDYLKLDYIELNKNSEKYGEFIFVEENDLKDSAKKVTQNAKKFFDKCKKINNDKKDNTDTDTVNQDNNFNNADNINETGNNKTVKNTNINENTDNENITNR